MGKMIIHVVVGGPKKDMPDLQMYNQEDIIWVGADRGVYYLLEAGITADRAFGDFDSVTTEELDLIKSKIVHIEQFKPEKDETDIELALNWAIAQKPEEIKIFGATGGRMDHTLVNIQLLNKSIESGISMQIIDKQNIVTIKEPNEHVIHKNDEYPYISFIPLTYKVSGINLVGFKYGLIDKTINMGSTLCVSNELDLEKGTYSFSEGILLVVRSKDL